jgi:beta-lactamase superfamily II metal-dependent hydrolase
MPGIQAQIKIVKIGQGDCILITSPTGKYILVDGGTLAGVSDAEGYTIDQVKRTLWGPQGIPDRPITILVMTHPDEDHYNKLGKLLGGTEVQKVFYSGSEAQYCANSFISWRWGTGDGFRRPALLPRFEGIWVNDGDPTPDVIHSELTANGQEFKLEVLAANYVPFVENEGQISSVLTNTRSIVIKGSLAGRSFLLTGDATDLTEGFLLAQSAAHTPPYFPVDVVKVAHHGSGHSSTQEFVDAAAPSDAVISCRPQGSGFKHPRFEIYSRWVAKVRASGDETAHPIIYWQLSWDGVWQMQQAPTSKAVWETGLNGTIVYNFTQDGLVQRFVNAFKDANDDGGADDPDYDPDEDQDSGSMTDDDDYPSSDDEDDPMSVE